MKRSMNRSNSGSDVLRSRNDEMGGAARPFQRLDFGKEQQEWVGNDCKNKIRSFVDVHNDAGSVESDEMPLQGIRVRKDLKWSSNK